MFAGFLLWATVVVASCLSGTNGQGAGDICFDPGECTGSLYLHSEEGIGDPQECLDLCRGWESGDCEYFTHYGAGREECVLFANCEDLSADSCTECYSGSVNCGDLQCWLDTGCQGVLLSQSYAYDDVACLDQCRSDPGCLWFTYKEEADECLLLESCQGEDEGCGHCVSGQRQCADRPELTKALVVAGWSDAGVGYLRSSEVFSLDEEDSGCASVADYPTYLRGAVSAVINGRPRICGGYTDPGNYYAPTELCYEYQKEINAWVPAPEMSTARGHCAGSLVQNKWLITGGYLDSDDPVTYQTTEYLEDEEFHTGPDLPEPLYSHCQVTLDNDMVFIGSPHSSCYLLDWNTQEWTQLPDPATARSSPACGVIRNSINGQEVVIVGKNTSEILNMADLTWRPGPSMTNFLDGGAVLQKRNTFSLLGGEAYDDDGSTGGTLGTLYNFDEEDYTWSLGGPVLEPNREQLEAILVDEDMVNC